MVRRCPSQCRDLRTSGFSFGKPATGGSETLVRTLLFRGATAPIRRNPQDSPYPLLFLYPGRTLKCPPAACSPRRAPRADRALWCPFSSRLCRFRDSALIIVTSDAPHGITDIVGDEERAAAIDRDSD